MVAVVVQARALQVLAADWLRRSKDLLGHLVTLRYPLLSLLWVSHTRREEPECGNNSRKGSELSLTVRTQTTLTLAQSLQRVMAP